jgi:hypothetical protein
VIRLKKFLKRFPPLVFAETDKPRQPVDTCQPCFAERVAHNSDRQIRFADFDARGVLKKKHQYSQVPNFKTGV